ncbi:MULTISPECIES: hypothetical protein [Haloarcula]|nr:hypothetical protein [Halomicroarcula sp. SHR3]
MTDLLAKQTSEAGEFGWVTPSDEAEGEPVPGLFEDRVVTTSHH